MVTPQRRENSPICNLSCFINALFSKTVQKYCFLVRCARFPKGRVCIFLKKIAQSSTLRSLQLVHNSMLRLSMFVVPNGIRVFLSLCLLVPNHIGTLSTRLFSARPPMTLSIIGCISRISPRLTPLLYILHQKNHTKIRFFLHISKKKCIFASGIVNGKENHVKRTIE